MQTLDHVDEGERQSRNSQVRATPQQFRKDCILSRKKIYLMLQIWCKIIGRDYWGFFIICRGEPDVTTINVKY